VKEGQQKGPGDARPVDDPTRLAEEARAIVDKNATEIREKRVPIATEPPATYRP
jgi:hypothetical protein